jgi:Bacterial protein of unknown function (Gcw_chp)
MGMESIGVRGKWFTVVGLILSLMIWWVPASLADEAKPEAKAEEAKGPELPTWNVGADLLSQYVWRGIALSKNSVVLQPSVTGTYKGFSFNSWSNIDTNERNPYGHNKHRGFVGNEMDLTASYTREVITNLTLTGG